MNYLALPTVGVDGIVGVDRARRRGVGRRHRRRREGSASSGGSASAIVEAVVVPADGLDGHRVGVAVRYLQRYFCDGNLNPVNLWKTGYCQPRGSFSRTNDSIFGMAMDITQPPFFF